VTRSIAILGRRGRDLDDLAAALSARADSRSEIVWVPDAGALLERLRGGDPPALVVVDYAHGDGRLDARAVLDRIRSFDRELPVVVVAAHADVDLVAEAVRAGATDFLVRGERLPDRVATLLGKLDRLLRLRERAEDAARQLRAARFHMVGSSRAIEQVRERIARVAPIPRPVLITGERGTGKELVARAIHAASGPATRPMVAVNCAAFAEGLIESELFGHEKGAFTGATHTVPGRFEQADGGTLFLDEIGNMPVAFQKKLLRVVEYGTCTRVGGRAEIAVAVRIVSATNVDLAQQIARGGFLADLHDRLAFETIHLPPLRERGEDLGALADHFLDLLGQEIPALRGKRLSATALAALQRYPFPGNLRELKNILERAAYRDTGAEIDAEDLGLGTPIPVVAAPVVAASTHAAPAGPASGRCADGKGTFREQVAGLEHGLLVDALRAAGGNQAEAARQLGLTYHQFRYYARKHSVE